MNELQYQLQKKHKTLDISPQHLGTIIRENNKTRKRTRHSHFPKLLRMIQTIKLFKYQQRNIAIKAK